MDAIAKVTILPARRLEDLVPAMKRKGRVQIDADADLVVFDPERIIDKATFAEPARFSEGIQWVLVGGTSVVREGRLMENARPGRAIRAPIRERRAMP